MAISKILEYTNDFSFDRFNRIRRSVSNSGYARTEIGSPVFYGMQCNLGPLTKDQFNEVEAELLALETGTEPFIFNSEVPKKIDATVAKNELEPTTTVIEPSPEVPSVSYTLTVSGNSGDTSVDITADADQSASLIASKSGTIKIADAMPAIPAMTGFVGPNRVGQDGFASAASVGATNVNIYRPGFDEDDPDHNAGRIDFDDITATTGEFIFSGTTYTWTNLVSSGSQTVSFDISPPLVHSASLFEDYTSFQYTPSTPEVPEVPANIVNWSNPVAITGGIRVDIDTALTEDLVGDYPTNDGTNRFSVAVGDNEISFNTFPNINEGDPDGAGGIGSGILTDPNGNEYTWTQISFTQISFQTVWQVTISGSGATEAVAANTAGWKLQSGLAGDPMLEVTGNSVPAIPGSTTIDTIQTTGASTGNTVTIENLLTGPSIGDYIQFDDHTKVYQIKSLTTLTNNETTITLNTSLIQNVPSGTTIKHSNNVEFKFLLQGRPNVTVIPGPGYNYYQYDQFNFREVL